MFPKYTAKLTTNGIKKSNSSIAKKIEINRTIQIRWFDKGQKVEGLSNLVLSVLVGLFGIKPEIFNTLD